MRPVLAGLLLLASACLPDTERGEPHVNRSALSTPIKVLTIDAGARTLFRANLVPLDGGLVLLDDEPWFLPASGGPAVYLGDLQAGWASSLSSAGAAKARVVGDRVYFIASSPTPDNAQTTLWDTDGTFAGTQPSYDGGTQRVIEIVEQTSLGLVIRVPSQPTSTNEALAIYRGPGSLPQPFLDLPSSSTLVTDFVNTSGGLVFYSTISSGRFQLVKTDGTTAGTTVLSANRTEFRDLFQPLVEFGGRGWFIAGESSGARYLSVTDGTPTGTRISSLGWNEVTAIAHTATDLVFVADVSFEPAAIFSDGTDAGTRIVIPPVFNTTLTRPRLLDTTNTHAFFWANSSPTKLGVLWGSDGTADGGVELAPFAPPAPTATQRFHLATANRLFFTDDQGRPWVSDGTLAGTVQLSASATGAASFTALDATRVVFSARTATTGNEPWVSDGTPAGTSLLRDLLPGGSGAVVSALVSAGGRAWFVCLAPSGGSQVCTTDGTPSGTTLASPVRGRLPIDRAYALGKANQHLLIVSSPRLLTWDRSNPPQTLPIRFTTVPPFEDPNGGAWVADFDQNLARLWHTDGTVAGTTQVLPDAGVPGAPHQLFVTPTTTFLVLLQGNVTPTLYTWRADAGAQLIDTTLAISLRDYTLFGNELTWGGLVPDAGSLIFSTDTANGTARVIGNPTPTIELDQVNGLTEFEGSLYFALLGASGGALHRLRSDGTTEELLPPVTNTLRSRWVRAGRNLYVVNGLGLSRFIPGTSTFETLATVPLSNAAETRAVGDGLLVVMRHVTTPPSYSVWATNGTVAGTRRLNGIFEGGNAPTLSSAWARSSDDIFLPTWTRETGLEPGVLVGTATSPVALADLCAGPCWSVAPIQPLAMGDTLYFVGDDGENPAIFTTELNVQSPGGGGGGGSGGAGGGSGGGSGGGATGGGSSASGGGEGTTGGGDGTMAPAGCGCTTDSGWLGLVMLLLFRRRT